MEGEAKRDYPAAIGYQSPWYKKYGYVEDHFSRLNSFHVLRISRWLTGWISVVLN